MNSLYIIYSNYHLYLTLLKVNYDLKTFGIRSGLILTEVTSGGRIM